MLDLLAALPTACLAGGGATQVPAASWTDPARAAATALQRDDCYSKPQQDKCRTFLQEDSASEEDIERLCGSLPSMPACTLRQQCSSGAAGGAYCQPFSLLGSLCAPSPAMGGCQRWAALCATSGSVVQQCVTGACSAWSVVGGPGDGGPAKAFCASLGLLRHPQE